MRYTRKQKLAIAKHQNQLYRYRDMWGNVTKTVYLCKRCRGDKEYDLDDLEVDHIIPRSVGGPEILDNLQLLCPKHNRKKGKGIWVKGKLIRVEPHTVKKRSGTSKSKGSTAKRKPPTVRRKVSTAKRKRSTVKRKPRTVRRKTRTVKGKTSSTKRKGSTVKRKRR
jgi:5-methylcytosine-specific restriction endonuclease McrA